MNNRKYKYYFKGRLFSAGGILPFDDNGIWTVCEKNSKGEVYTDIGGKFTPEDCDIIGTIVREFREEMYNLYEIPYSKLKELSEEIKPIFVYNADGRSNYMSYPVHINKLDIEFDPVAFNEARTGVLEHNKFIPEYFYKPCELKYIRFDELDDYNLSFRLKIVIKHSKINSNE